MLLMNFDKKIGLTQELAKNQENNKRWTRLKAVNKEKAPNAGSLDCN